MKDKVLEIIKEESLKSNIRQYTCINGFGYSQYERDIADRVVGLCNPPKFIKKIDWNELRNQKNLLLETINNDNVQPKHKEALEGILSLIDATQDYAVDEMKLKETDVFELED